MVEQEPTTANIHDPTDSPTRVLIVDDHELLRDCLRLMFGNELNLEVCGEAEDQVHAVEQFRRLQPDLVIVDISLSSGDGIDLIKCLKAINPDVRVIVSSMYDERIYGERALRAGAMGYVAKQNPGRTFLDAVRRVLDGKMYFSDKLTERVLHRAADGEIELEHSPVDDLSDRELEVFHLIGKGLVASQIATSLDLSRHTVETYRGRLKTKLDLHNAGELSRYAIQWALENQ